MQIPREFNDMCYHFHQDVGLLGFSGEKIIGNAVNSLTPEQRDTVRRFLDELLNGQHDAAEIKKVWWDSPAEIYPLNEEGLLQLLKMLRDALQ